MTARDVLIGGAGIGGLALARGLHAGGHRVRVVERSSARDPGGAALTVYPNGAAALHRLGVRLDGLGAQIDRLEFSSARGTRLFNIDLRPMQQRFGSPVRTIRRRDLIDVLEDGLPEGVVRHGAAVEEVHVTGDVSVTLVTGEELTAQLLVGADGAHSVIRGKVLDATPAVGAGWATWQGLTHVLPELASGASGEFLVGDNGFVGMMPSGNGLLQWWFDVPWSNDDPSLLSPVDWLRDRFSGYLGSVPFLLQSISDDEIGFFPHVIHRIPDRWGTGPTTLLGDAAHAFPPSQAQGGNQAFEDAAVLTASLALDGDLVDLLRRYERRRSERVRLVSRMAASERTNKPPTALLRAAARLTPAALASRSYARLIQKFSSVLSGDIP